MDENNDNLSLFERLPINTLHKIFYYICEGYDFDSDIENVENILNLSYCSKRLHMTVEKYKCIYGLRDMRELKINKTIGGHLLYIDGEKQNTIFDIKQERTSEEANDIDLRLSLSGIDRRLSLLGIDLRLPVTEVNIMNRNYIHYISNVQTRNTTYEMKIDISNTMPDLKKIYFDGLYGTIKALPEQIKELHIYNNVYDEEDEEMIVFETNICNLNNLTVLVIYGYVNGQFIDELYKLSNLVSLELSGFINSSLLFQERRLAVSSKKGTIKKFPPTLRALTMGSYNNIGLDDVIRDLALHELNLYSYTHNIRYFPRTLKKLELSRYNIKFEELPKGLVYLALGDYNHIGLGNILKSLHNLKYLFLQKYSHKIDVLPRNIEELYLRKYNNYDICDLFYNMNSLTTLDLGGYTHQITYLPPCLRVLIASKYNIDGFDVVLSNLENLRKIILIEYTHKITTLPKSLQCIYLPKYNHNELKDILLSLPHIHTAFWESGNFLTFRGDICKESN